MHKFFLFLLTGMFFFSLHSCMPAKKLYYFHDQTPSTFKKVDSMKLASQMRIQKGDRLSITVSSRDNTITDFLNPFSGKNMGVEAQGNGFLVSSKGKIDFPLIGEIAVEGLTSEDAAALIKKELFVFYKDPYVYVNLPGKVYFINNHGGTAIQIHNERLTIFEAIAQANSPDANEVKDKVWVVREEGGQRTYAQVNLNSKDIFISPYYYLHNNDLIYVKQNRFSTFFNTNSPARGVLTLTATAIATFLALRRL